MNVQVNRVPVQDKSYYLVIYILNNGQTTYKAILEETGEILTVQANNQGEVKSFAPMCRVTEVK